MAIMGSYSQWETYPRETGGAPEAGSDSTRLSLLGRCPEWVVIDRWEDAQFYIPVYVS
jgi:hypothetical protein